MFSMLELTATAVSASLSMASVVNSSVRPSVAISAMYCLMRLASRLGEDAAEILARQGLQFDADRQAALQFRQQVRRLRDVECARGNEQNVVGFHGPVLGRDRRALDQGQQIALHPFT